SYFPCAGIGECVSSQPTLTQPPSKSVSLGQTVKLSWQTIKLSCTSSSSPSTVYWVQQRAGQAPRFVHCDGCSRGPGIPDRFTGTRSGSVGYLTITNTQAEDEADYYCYMGYSSTFHRIPAESPSASRTKKGECHQRWEIPKQGIAHFRGDVLQLWWA
uniref:Ig-like domain-containing protein n=1 Tax=Salvator merianae TaxID=96440 RepID=A0A8D0BNG2_SALMN